MLDLTGYKYETMVGGGSGYRNLTAGRTYLIVPYNNNIDLQTPSGNRILSTDKPIKICVTSDVTYVCGAGVLYYKA